MYPEGFHPVKYSYKRDYSGWATYVPRSVAGVRYYFADFGISAYIPGEEHQKFVTGVLGRDQEPPELSETVPYDPFKLDIFIIGNMLKQEFCDVIVPRSVASRKNSSSPRNSPIPTSFGRSPHGWPTRIQSKGQQPKRRYVGGSRCGKRSLRLARSGDRAGGQKAGWKQRLWMRCRCIVFPCISPGLSTKDSAGGDR